MGGDGDGRDVGVNRKVEQGEETRAHLVAVARSLFAERGFAGVATTEIVERAGVTRGALYHHFPSKEDLFRAVWEAVENDLLARVVEQSAAGSDPLEQIRLGSAAFLDVCLEPDVQQVTLVDGPVVLGWARWQELEARYSLAVVVTGLEAAMEAGLVVRQPSEPLAQVLLAALSHAGLQVARADDPAAARRVYGDVVNRLLASLVLPSPGRDE